MSKGNSKQSNQLPLKRLTRVEWIGSEQGALKPGAKGRVVSIEGTAILVRWDDERVQFGFGDVNIPLQHLKPIVPKPPSSS